MKRHGVIYLRFCQAALLLAAYKVALAEEPASTRSGQPLIDLYGDPLPVHALLRLGTERLHGEYVQAAAFSPDGDTLATAAMNYATEDSLWELPSGRMLRRRKVRADNPSWTYSLAFSPDGKKLLTGDVGGTLHLWDSATGDEIYAIAAHGGFPGATALAFTPDGEWFASGGAEGAVRVWSTGQGRELLSIDMLAQAQKNRPGGGFAGAIPGSIAAVAFSPDGKLLAAGAAQRPPQSKTGQIRIWDVKANQPVRYIDESNVELMSLAFTPDGKQLVAGGNVTIPQETFGKAYHALNVRVVQLRVWDVASGKMVRELATSEREAGYGAMALSKDARLLAVGYEDKVLIWDFPAGQVVRTIDVPGWYGDRGLAISADGQLVCARDGTTTQIWETTTGNSLLPTTKAHTNAVAAITYSSDGKLIVSGGEMLRVWDASTGRQQWARSMGPQGGIKALAISPDSKLVAAGGVIDHGEDGVRVWRSASGEQALYIPMFEKKYHTRHVRALAFSADGRKLAIARAQRKRSNADDIELWDIRGGKKIIEIATGFILKTNDLAFSPDGKLVYSIDKTGVVGAWDAVTGERRRQFTALKLPPEAAGGKAIGGVADAVFVKDLTTLVTSPNRDLVIWDLARGEPTATIATQNSDTGALIAVSSDGRLLASSDAFHYHAGPVAIQVCDLKNQRKVATFEPAQGRAVSMAFCPDGTRLVTGMSDGTALVWDLATAARSRLTE